jgi:energy-coupling factor transport system substrate-specific component
MQRKATVLKIVQPITIVLCAALLVAMAILDVQQTALLSLAVVILAMVPYFLRFERLRPKPRDIVPIVVLSVIAALGRALFTFAPNIQPVTAIVIISGVVFGSQAGFLTGALSALASNMVMGQGPWTPWQMLAWGLIGYVAGLLSSTIVFRKNVFLLIYGFIASFAFGWIMNVWNVYGFVENASWQAFVVSTVASSYFDLIHAISTVVFLGLIAIPWRKKLLRIKQKYGMDDIGQES